MKKIIFCVILITLSLKTLAQPSKNLYDTNQVDNFANTINRVGIAALNPNTTDFKLNDSYLLTRNSVAKLFAQKLAYYLSGTNDISLFDNYLLFNPAKTDLTLGYNRGFRDNNENVRRLLTVALTTGLKDNIASLRRNRDWDNSLKGSIKYSFGLNRGIINYSSANAAIFHGIIGKDNRLFEQKRIKEINDYTNLLNAAYPGDAATIAAKLAKFTTATDKKYVEEAIANEVSLSDDYYSSIFLNWFSTFCNYSFTPTESKVGSETHDYRNIEAGLSWNLFRENPKGFTWIVNTSFSYSSNNNAAIVDLFEGLDSDDSTALIKNLDVRKKGNTYTGNFHRVDTYHVKPQLFLFYNPLENYLKKAKLTKSFLSNIGLNLGADFQSGKYSFSTLKFGILFNLKIKDDKPMNFNLNFNFRDYNDRLLPNISSRQKRLINFTFSLPFNSIIY